MVSLAAQLISDSVATAINYCYNILHLQRFRDSEATVIFLKIFDKLFDVMNSRSLWQLGFKEAMSQRNFHKINSFLEEADCYISSLKVSRSGESILKSSRKMGFCGFRIRIKSLSHLAKTLLFGGAPLLKCISMYKISQDFVEEEHTYDFDANILSEYSKHITYFIAEYI